MGRGAERLTQKCGVEGVRLFFDSIVYLIDSPQWRCDSGSHAQPISGLKALAESSSASIEAFGDGPGPYLQSTGSYSTSDSLLFHFRRANERGTWASLSFNV